MQDVSPFSTQAKMLFHMDRVQQWRLSGCKHSDPLAVEINLTDNCNLKCQWCMSENFRKGTSQDYDALSKFLEDFTNLGGKSITLSGGGEPTLYPHFKEVVCRADQLGLDVGLMTNGFFNPTKLIETIGYSMKWVRVSLDTVSHEQYKKWKGVDAVDAVFENIRFLSELPVKLGVNCNVPVGMTTHDVERLICAVKPYTDYIQFRPVLPRYFKEERININREVWDYLQSEHSGDSQIMFSLDKLFDLINGERHDNMFPYDACEGHFFSFVLDSNGDVNVCMYHTENPKFTMGNIRNERFEDIWDGKRRQTVIENCRSLDFKSECQVCCKLHELNKFLEFYKNPTPGMDINFI